MSKDLYELVSEYQRVLVDIDAYQEMSCKAKSERERKKATGKMITLLVKRDEIWLHMLKASKDLSPLSRVEEIAELCEIVKSSRRTGDYDGDEVAALSSAFDNLLKLLLRKTAAEMFAPKQRMVLR